MTQVRTTEAAAQALKLQVRILEVKDPNDFAAAFATAKREHAEALDVLVSTFLTTHRKSLLDLAVKSHLPSMYEDKIFVGDGGAYVVWAKPSWYISACRDVCRQNPKRRKACRLASGATDGIRIRN